MCDSCIVRRFRGSDAQAVSAPIIKTLRTTITKDYCPEYIEHTAREFTPDGEQLYRFEKFR